MARGKFELTGAEMAEAKTRARETVMLARKCPDCGSSIVVVTRYGGGPVRCACPVCAVLREGPPAEPLELQRGGLLS